MAVFLFICTTYILNKYKNLSLFKENVGDNVGDPKQLKLSERQELIRLLIKTNAKVSAKQMSEILSVTSRTIERDLSIMHKLGVVRREGSDKFGVLHTANV